MRINIISIFFGLAFVAIISRLFFWQVLKASELSESGKNQQNNQRLLYAHRGNILASDNTWLASSVDAWVLFAEPDHLKETPRVIANKLAPLLVTDSEDKQMILDEAMRLEGLLQKKELQWVALKNKVNTENKKNIDALNIYGLGFDKTEARSYPEASSAAQLLGFVGRDDKGNDQGYFGLEGYYDLSLTGKPGLLSRESDARGVPLVFGNSRESLAIRGIDLVTHIDKFVQMTVEKELQKGIEHYGAVSGNVIILDPYTGGIIASASYPSYDPGKYSSFGDQLFRDPTIAEVFEPGSIFKPLVMAAGLDAGVIQPDSLCEICDKPLKVDKYEIETWDHKYHPDETMTDVIVNSDNVGMSFVGQKLGQEKLFDYLKNYGFSQKTGIDLQGEVASQLRPRGTWSEVDTATTTFGQGIAVTPMQMIKAVAIIANGGREVAPRVVGKIQRDDWYEEIKPQLGKQVISAKASDQITTMMLAAVKKGEAKWAAPKGFEIAGKTGTAQIPVSGHYDATKTIASFVGFAPARHPRFVMLVTLKEPQTSQWGSETAAPLWFNIAREIFPYLGIQPES